MSIPGAANPLFLSTAAGGAAAGYAINRSLRFNPGDSAYLNRTPSSAGNRKTFTLSYWIKECGKGTSPSNNPHILWSGTGSATRGGFAHRGTGSDAGKLYLFNQESTSTNCAVYTNSLHRDFSAWKHIVLAVDTTQATSTNRVKIYINGVEETLNFSTTPAQNLELQINASQLHQIGRGTPDDYANAFLADVQFIDNQSLSASDFGETDSNGVWQPKEFAGAYYIDVANATGSAPIYNTTDKFGLVKGTGYRSDSFAGTTAGTGLVLAIPGDVATDVHHSINTGSSQATVTNDGVAVVTSNSRFYGSSLEFQSANTDSLTIENSNMALGTGDFCVEFWVYSKTNKNYNAFISTRASNGAETGFVIASDIGGDLYVHSNAALAGNYSGDITLPLNQWNHVAYTRASGTHRLFLNGVAASNSTTTSRDFTYNKLRIGDNAYGTDEPINAEMQDIRVYKGVAKYTSNFTVPDRVSNSFHLDFSDAADLGNDSSGANNDWTPNNLVGQVGTGDLGMDVITYTGTGSSNAITGLKFSPGLLWFKHRNGTSYHELYDTTRSATYRLFSNTTDGQEVNSSLTSFDSNGFTLTYNGGQNVNNNTYVAWAWKAGGAAVSNTDGTITSSVSANQTHGFSIATFTSPSSGNFTFGTGLNAVPKVVIVKTTGATSDWSVYHASVTDTTSKYLVLNSNAALATYSTIWGAALPTSTVVGLTSGGAVATSQTCVAYCWSEVAGYSKFGTYTGGSGTQSITGLGFKPRFVILKRTDSSSNWWIQDSERGPSSSDQLYADLNVQEQGGPTISFDTDGFTFQNYTGGANASGGSYIYIAFAAGGDGADLDSLLDTPEQRSGQTDTGVGNEIVGNYATLNPISISGYLPYASVANGNLYVSGTSTANDGVVPATIAVATGKWYWEYTSLGVAASGYSTIGIMPTSGIFDSNGYLGGVSNSCGYRQDGTLKKTGSDTSSWGATWGSGDVIGVALDCDSGAIYFSKNGTWQNSGVPSSGSSKTGAAITWTGTTIDMYPICDMYRTGSNGNLNFGQRAFHTAAPSGYKCLNTANLPDPTIADGSTYFDTKLYTGNGGTQTISGLNFSPDFVWIKNRGAVENHSLSDIVRGANKQLQSSSTSAESTHSNQLTGFTSDGFTLGLSAQVNQNSTGIAAWAWDAGSSTVTNTDGSISAQVRANPTAGFSIVSYTATGSNLTVGHGLNAKPALIFLKSRSATGDWLVMHESIGVDHFLKLNLTQAKAGPYSNVFTSVSSTTFGTGNDSGINTNGVTKIAYCFAPVEGYSAFGSYVGNGSSSDGTFVYVGFRPAFLLVKGTSGNKNWQIYDTSRDPINVMSTNLKPNSSEADSDSSNHNMDMLSNGFKFYTTSDNRNASGETYVYLAFASHPFRSSRAR